MKSFAEFESDFLAALQQERSDLQSLHGASEAQLSAWIEHLFRQYLGYTHWKEITREAGATIGAKGTKQLFPDLRIDILDNGVIFVECKRLGRLDGTKGQEELNDGVSQLRSYIRAHVDQAGIKPKTVIGVVTMMTGTRSVLATWATSSSRLTWVKGRWRAVVAPHQHRHQLCRGWAWAKGKAARIHFDGGECERQLPKTLKSN
jgi:hypothetical protein